MATIFVRKNTADLRDRIKDLGFDICKCAEFDGWDWLCFNTDRPKVIHGIPPSNQDPIKRVEEGDRGLFLHELTDEDVDLGEDCDMFITRLSICGTLINDRVNVALDLHETRQKTK